MLRVNQLLVEFDTSLERICTEILEFWEDLLNTRDTITLFTKGIEIARQLKHVQELLEDIQAKQSDKESKIYLQMAQFYSQVVFKSNECMQMLEKARMAIQVKKVNKMTSDRGNTSLGGEGQEKCLLMAHINLKKPMRITFINKAALKLTQYSMSEALLLAINNIMPQFIGDMHQCFLDEFMATGKTRMLKTRRELFIKQRRGTLVPVHTYLFVNNMSRKHMILMFEPNPNYQVFEDTTGSDTPFTFLLADQNYKLGECAVNFQAITGIHMTSFKSLKEERDKDIYCDDFLKVTTVESEVCDLLDSYDLQEVEVQFKNLTQNISFDDMGNETATEVDNGIEKSLLPSVSSQSSVSKAFVSRFGNFQQLLENDLKKNQMKALHDATMKKKSSQLLVVGSPLNQRINAPLTFTMRIIDIRFMGGKKLVRLLAFKRKNDPFASAGGSSNAVLNTVGMQENRTHSENNDGDKKKAPTTNQSGDDSNISINEAGIGRKEEGSIAVGAYFDVMSQSSSASVNSSNSTTVSIFTAYTTQVNSDATPKTLKFILNMVIIIIVVMISASSLILSISLSNLNAAIVSIQVCKHSFLTLDQITTTRLLLRSVVNIYQGYEPRSNQYFADRLTLYESLMIDLSERMRENANYVTSISDQQSSSLATDQIECGFLSTQGTYFTLNQTLSQGMNLLTTKVHDVATAVERENILGKSEQSYLNLAAANGSLQRRNQSQKMLAAVERDSFFIVNNTNGQLYIQLKEFGPRFSKYQIDQINNERQYLTGLCLGVMCIILLSALVVIPLFGKIQNRILELMKLFFSIDPQVKRTVISRIETFQRQYYKQQQQNDENSDSEDRSSPNQLSSSQIAGFFAKKGKNSSTNKLMKESLPKLIFTPPGGETATDDGNKKMDLKKTNSNGKNQKKHKLSQAFGIKKSRSESKQDEHQEEIKEEDIDLEEKPHKKRKKNKKSHLDILMDIGKLPSKGASKSKNDSSSSEEEAVEDEAHREANRKLTKDNEIKALQQSMLLDQERDVIMEFSKYTDKRKIVQAIAIITLLILMASYFLIKYLLSARMHGKIESSLIDMKTIYERLSCSQNVINQYTEAYFIQSSGQNVQSSKDFLILDSKIEECMDLEKRFQQTILANPDEYLTSSNSFIVSVEKGSLCENTTLNPEICLAISDQIRKQGLATYYFNIMKVIKQLELDLIAVIKAEKYNAIFASNQLKNKIAPYIDTITLVVLPMQDKVQDAAYNSINDYFNSQGTIFSIIYGAYMIATALAGIYFVSNMYQRLRREMLLSNKLLYIIDFESLKEIERAIILRFLQNY